MEREPVLTSGGETKLIIYYTINKQTKIYYIDIFFKSMTVLSYSTDEKRKKIKE